MTFLIAFIFAGGSGVLEERTGSAFTKEMANSGRGNISFDWRKWYARVEEIGYLNKKLQGRSIMGCRLVP